MKITKQRIALVAVLAVAGGALLFDRLTSGGAPAPSAHAESAAAPASPSTPALAAAEPSSPSAPLEAEAPTTLSVTERLAAISKSSSEASPSGDALALPDQWIALAFPPPVPPAPAAGKARLDETKFTLTCVINTFNHTPAAARINNRLVKVGEKIDGYTLSSLIVNRDKSWSALLKGPNGDLTVSLRTAANTRTDLADAESPSADADAK